MIPWIVAWRVVVSMPQSKESRRCFSVEAVALPNLPQTGYAVYVLLQYIVSKNRRNNESIPHGAGADRLCFTEFLIA